MADLTFDIDDSILAAALARAEQEGTTLSELCAAELEMYVRDGARTASAPTDPKAE